MDDSTVYKSGCWFGTMEFYDFPYIGNVIIPTDELHHFSEGLAAPPTSHGWSQRWDFIKVDNVNPGFC